ncbi:MAG: TolB family protein [Cyclobacteriaceae bacterium]|nr:TolB family protein [Cyclobacteriaceae bacterium]
MKMFLLTLIIGLLMQANAQNQVGIFENHLDVGNPKKKGNTIYDSERQEYRLAGSGYNIWFGRDEFHYTYKKLNGDFIATANFKFVGTGIDPHRKIGWMVRSSTDEDAPHIVATVHGDGLTTLQWRQLKGAHMRDPEDEIRFAKRGVQIIQLERSGPEYIMRVAHVGEPLQEVGRYALKSLPDNVLVGLFISAHNEEVVEEAIAWNVRMDKPVPDNYNPNQSGYIGCRLEVLNVFDGVRKVIHEAPGRFEAPNWMPDGKRLLFNQDGSLFTIPVTGGKTEKLNTGVADRNNNDHVISFDGKMLAISHHREGLPGGGSTVYTLPLTGGTPKLITEKTPSYLHGWSADGKDLVFVGQRDGTRYDIYKISAKGGDEIKLTNNTGFHVDGCEYSPDGKFIYYNSSQSGTMQLWRMKPDGTSPEQITYDEFNDWFPHISPDGKWIAFISFPTTVAPNDHPSYKRVMLRLMPAAGGPPKVIAYLYGGQGTINVPSWSPDSKQIAFVSNSERSVKE